ncbi:hypothetical protein HF568_09990 [Acidithiobacillus ferridurans]|uniref:Uncharacterized protein n=1 Tax=Acidithiobacillus ferridurans TaxID=1232575 RepID=A0A8X8GDH5_ACIFI|nr:hypothetical protein [Acidithiobacillus ferridurans]
MNSICSPAKMWGRLRPLYDLPRTATDVTGTAMSFVVLRSGAVHDFV